MVYYASGQGAVFCEFITALKHWQTSLIVNNCALGNGPCNAHIKSVSVLDLPSEAVVSTLMEAPWFNDHVTLGIGVPWGYPWLEPDCASANLALFSPFSLTP